MARMMDDSSHAQMLMQMLSQQSPQAPAPLMGGPASGDPNMSGQQVPEEEITNPRGPRPSNGVGVADAGREQMVSVPVSLANAGMQALMMQASGGRSLGADGAGEDAEPGDAEYDQDDKESNQMMKRRRRG